MASRFSPSRSSAARSTSSLLGASTSAGGGGRRGRRKPPPPLWLVIAAAASGLMLVIAHAFETFGHLPPCELCLHQREGYWVALTVALVGLVVARVARPAPRLFALLLAFVFMIEAALAVYHSGVEWHWWPGPTSCTGGRAHVALGDMAALMHGAKVNFVQCDQAAWRMLGLSMAGWNALAAAGLALISFAVAAASGTRGLRDR